MITFAISVKVERLKGIANSSGKYRKSYPRVAQEPVILSRPHLSISRLSFQPPFHLLDDKLSKWLRPADVLPLIKEWKEKCLDDREMYQQIQKLRPASYRPWMVRVAQIANHAQFYRTQEFELKIKSGPVLAVTADLAAKIVKW